MNSPFSIVMQPGPDACGPACLAAVAHAHGIVLVPASLPSAPAGGASLLELARVAGSIGLDARGVSLSPRHLEGVPLPAIAHLDFGDGPGDRGHYVVVHAVCEDGLTVADPAQGVCFMPRPVSSISSCRPCEPARWRRRRTTSGT